MARDFRDFVNEVSARASIVRVASDYMKLKKQGNRYVGLCPFHKEKTPSFSISPDKNLYHCFGCGVGGNLFGFVMEMENVEFAEALRMVAEKSGIPIPAFSGAKHVDKAKFGPLYEINEVAASWFFQNLMSNKEAYSYITDRGISEDTLRKYRIGYALDTWDELLKHVKKHKFDEDTISKSGLFSIGKDNKFRDIFRGRVVFPIHDYAGKIIAFGGRTIKDDNIKYLNTPNTPIFHKSRNLFGIDKAAKPIREQREGILVEGYFDQIILWQAGFKNVVAPLGTAFNEQAASVLKRFTDRLTVVFDSDEAGKKAALRTLGPLLSNGFDVKFLSLPEGMDPDDYIRKNSSEAFKERLSHAVTMFDYMYEESIRGIDLESVREKVKALERMIEYLNSIQDMAERDLYFRKLAGRMELSESVVLERAKKLAYRGQRRESQKEAQQKRVLSLDEKKLMKIVLDGHFYFRDQLIELLDIKAVSITTAKILRAALDAVSEDDTGINVTVLLGELREEEEKNLLSMIMVEDIEFKDEPEYELLQCIRSIKKRYLRNLLKNQKILLSEASEDEEEQKITEILEIMHDLACQIEKLS